MRTGIVRDGLTMAPSSFDMEPLVMRRKSRGKAKAADTVGPSESFGHRLAEIRKARGFSQYDLANELGISQRMVAYYEAQGQRPPAHLLPQLAEILGVTADQLLGLKRLKENGNVGHARLWRKLRQVEKLPPADRRALLKMLDALLAQRAN